MAPTMKQMLYDAMSGQYEHMASALNGLIHGLDLDYEEAVMLVNLVLILWRPDAQDEQVAAAVWMTWLDWLRRGRQRPLEPMLNLDRRKPEVQAFQRLTRSIIERYRYLHNTLESTRQRESALAER